MRILILVFMLMVVVPQRLAVERMEKLGEQLEEARKLRQSIFRRGDAVFAILSRYLNPLSIIILMSLISLLQCIYISLLPFSHGTSTHALHI